MAGGAFCLVARGAPARDFLPVNPERLAELERQRDLVRAQLAWLDREIARELPPNTIAPSGADRDAPKISPGPTTSTELAPAPAFSLPPRADASLSQYEPDGGSVAKSARRGCLMAAIIGFLLMAAVFTTFLLLRYGDRPLLFMERDGPAEKLDAPAAPPPRK